MNSLKHITAIAGIVLLFTTCKKYPEGGFQNQAKKHILGNWTLTLYEVDGIDSTIFLLWSIRTLNNFRVYFITIMLLQL